MPNAQDEVRSLVEDFVEKLSALIQRAAVESAVKALQDTAPSSLRTRSPIRAPRSRLRRSTEAIQKTLDRVVAFVEAHPGSRAEQIRKALKLSSAQTGDSLSRLVDSKTLKRKGQRRASTYTKG